MVCKFFHYLPIFGMHIHIHIYEDSHEVGKAYDRYAKKLGMDADENGEFKYVHVYEDGPDAERAFKKRSKVKAHEQGSESRGIVFDDSDNCRIYVFYSKKDLTTELVTHEVYHLVHAIYRLHNIKKKDETETAALLHEYFNKLIVQKLKKKKITVA